MDFSTTDAVQSDELSFRFLSLPRELRDEIYYYYFQIHGDFVIGHTPDEPSFPCLFWSTGRLFRGQWRLLRDPNHWCHDGFEDNHEYHGMEQHDFYRAIRARQSLSWSVAFSLSRPMYCSFLLVNKQVLREALPVWKKFAIEAQELLAANVVGGRFVKSPSPAFLQLVENSRFVVETNARMCIESLCAFPDLAQQSIRSIVLSDRCLNADIADFHPTFGFGHSRYTQITLALRRHLPQLEEVAIILPNGQGGGRIYEIVSTEMSEMLQSTSLQTVRFLIRAQFSKETLVQTYPFKKVIETNDDVVIAPADWHLARLGSNATSYHNGHKSWGVVTRVKRDGSLKDFYEQKVLEHKSNLARTSGSLRGPSLLRHADIPS